MSLDDFSKRIRPGHVGSRCEHEADALNMYKDVLTLSIRTPPPLRGTPFLTVARHLNDNLAPMDNQRKCSLSTSCRSSWSMPRVCSKTLAKSASRRRHDGRSAGFDFYENTLLVPGTPPAHRRKGHDLHGQRRSHHERSSSVVVATGATIQVGRRFHRLPVATASITKPGFYRRTATVRGHCGLRWRRLVR